MVLDQKRNVFERMQMLTSGVRSLLMPSVFCVFLICMFCFYTRVPLFYKKPFVYKNVCVYKNETVRTGLYHIILFYSETYDEYAPTSTVYSKCVI